ncbi:GNAT family N-acetyltransferase [Flavobacterium cyanobacteriorum]|uniref:GNAT family N-acetyltransferase n=1 Tax=Flavobacterium cyanobacteriorum TaxID=2022802 RepID=A0A255Z8J4_9FLAO|nr:GNAT family N-acetyltransferase [Flavobacterium cyanobacteriorum]OYQ37769.1 GNAT family N-acetyltransferase [Flavobacterium cyanobacteriorum]
MVTLKGDKAYLRALEPEDLEFVYAIENDESMWKLSNTQAPYSRFLIRSYLENAHQDIYQARQLRLAICLTEDNTAAGLIDLFDFDPDNRRAGIGVVLLERYRNRGIGKEALRLLVDYSFTHLRLRQLYANIDVSNTASKMLFTNFGFRCVGVKKEWNNRGTYFEDEELYQLINNNKTI